MNKYVIIGNGIAAAGCIEGIRSIDKAGDITVISEENHAVYCRPLISYYLEGRTDLQRIRYRSEDFYEKMHCSVIYGQKAARIHTDTHRIELENGMTLPYTKACAAVGSVPFVPLFKGLDTVSKKFSFMTLDDALALEKAIDKTSRVLIIGAGLIGLKCAEGITGRVKKVTVCDLADRIFSSILDYDCAEMMQRHLQEHGMEFLLNDSAVLFKGNKAFMKSGSEVEFDILVLAVGVRPNISLINDAGGETNRGILVNDHMHTSIPDIYAVGDCVEIPDIASGRKKVLATLPNAAMQGFTAGVNMAGGSSVFDKGILMNSFGFFGYPAMTAGSYEGDLFEVRTEDSIKRIYTKDDLLKGFMLIGCKERAGIYTSMIREQTPLSSVNFELMKMAATTAAFPEKERRQKFGREV